MELSIGYLDEKGGAPSTEFVENVMGVEEKEDGLYYWFEPSRICTFRHRDTYVFFTVEG